MLISIQVGGIFLILIEVFLMLPVLFGRAGIIVMQFGCIFILNYLFSNIRVYPAFAEGPLCLNRIIWAYKLYLRIRAVSKILFFVAL